MARRLRVDLHMHSSASRDCTVAPQRMADAARRLGLSPVVLTDHDTIAGAVTLRQSGVPVIVGQEISTADGELIGLFLEEAVPRDLPATATVRAIKEQGGLVYVQHPYDRYRKHLPEEVLERIADDIDIVEVFNARCDDEANQLANDLRITLGVAAGAGSDAHRSEDVGAGYVELDPFDNAQGFLRSLRGGRIADRQGRRRLRARNWLYRGASRILPP